MPKQDAARKEKIVLAYSGGLDTSIIIPWLKENYAYEVIAMVADVGQGDDVEAVGSKAYKTGASKVVVEDLREEFLTGYVWPALKVGAVLNTYKMKKHFDLDITEADYALGYRFDIVLRGRDTTPMEG